MVYNVSQIETALASLVGFESLEGYTLSSPLTSATFKMNNYHPLLQLSILDNVKPEGTTLDAFLQNVRKTAVTSTLNDLVTKKLAGKGIKSKLSDTIVFDSTARFTNLISNNGKFVGWSFRPVRSGNLVTKINKVAVQFLEPVINLQLYVFHSSQQDVIETREINTTKSSSVEWVTLEEPIILKYSDHDAGGYYFIGYYQNDLMLASSPTNRAIYKEHDLSVAPCGSCNKWNGTYYKEWSKFLKIDTGTFDPMFDGDTSFPSHEKINFGENKNYGLNFSIETNCDITDFIINNKSLFAPTLQVRYAMELLRYLDMSPIRKNVVTDTMKNEAFTAIHGSISENNYIKVRGLSHDYRDYMEGLNLDTSYLDPICLASTARGISWNKGGVYKY